MRKLYYLTFLILSLVSALESNYSESNVELFIKFNGTNIDTYKISLYNEYYVKNNLLNLEIEGKLCVFKFMFIFDVRVIYNPCSDESIVIIDDINIARNLQTLYYSGHPKRILYKAILYKGKNATMVIQDLSRPLLLINDTTFDSLVDYYNLGNINVVISYNTIYDLLPFNYINLSAFIGIIISLGVIIYWNILNFYTYNLTTLQKVIILLPCFKCTIYFCVFYLLNVKIIKNRNISYDDNLNKMFYDTILSTMNSIYKTLFWFILIMLSKGWHIITNSLINFNMTNIVCIYLSLYLFLCIDQIFQIVNEDNFNLISVSEIKNIILFFCISIYIHFKTSKMIRILESRFIYSTYYIHEISSLLLNKMKIFRVVRICSLLSFLLIIVDLIFSKYFFIKNPYSLIVYTISSSNFEFVSMIILIILFRPIKIPVIEINDLDLIKYDYRGYEVKIQNKLIEEDYQIKLENLDNVTPVILINPTICSNMIENISIGYKI